MSNRALIDRIARSVLYEGYLLYPYRPSALKNARRCTFGTLYPESQIAGTGGPDRSAFRSEMIFSGPAGSRISVLGRYLLDEEETEVAFETTVAEARREQLGDAELAFSSIRVRDDLFKLTVTLRNTGDSQSLISAHAVVTVETGELISLTDPPAEFAKDASDCRNDGVWPVLIGAPGTHDTMLAAPIILPDHPEVAPESVGDLCDATEIEEILTLRILTLTDEEKAEVRASQSRARHILEQAEGLPMEHMLKLHGTIRGLAPAGSEAWSKWDTWANRPPVDTITVGGAELKAGDRVRLKPGGRADIFDLALQGRTAVIAGIEQDFENKVHVAVVIDDDPGRDLGEMRQTGHRFFFSPEEIELP